MVEDDRGYRKTTTVNAYLRKDRRNTMRYRLRQQARSHYVLAGLWLAAVAAHWAGGLTGAGGRPAAAATVVAALGVLAAGGWMRRTRRRAPVGGRLVAGWAAAAGWLAVTVLAGPSWPAAAVLVVGGYAASLAWWRRHRLPDPAEAPAPPPPADESDPVLLWQRHIATGGELPGSRLTNRQATDTGLRYELRLKPGQQTLGRALAAIPTLRTGLRLMPGQDLVLERHPALDESVLQATIVRRSRVLTDAAIPWPGPGYDPATGLVPLGPYVDGDGVAQWRLHTPGSLWGGLFIGSIGSGKSRMLEILALQLAAAGVVVWYVDTQGGASSPFLAAHADLFAGDLETIAGMLALLGRVKALRQEQNAVYGWTGWAPDQGRPGIVIIIDECHDPLANDEVQEAISTLAREGRKLGMAVVLADQQPQQEVFGRRGGQSADALRSSVVAGNMVILQSLTYSTRNVLPGVNVDPTTFPAVAGYGWLIDRTKTRRSAPLRGYFLSDDAWEQAAAAITWPQLDPAAAGAAGPDYTLRAEHAEARRAEQAERLAARGRGEDPDQQPPPATSAPTVTTAAGNGAAAGPGPAWATWRPQPAPEPATEGGEARRTAVEVVYGLIATGVNRTGSIIDRSGYSKSQVFNALNQLLADRRIADAGHGRWAAGKTLKGAS